MSAIRDVSLAPFGKQRIAWVREFMPVMRALEDRFSVEQPFTGLRVSVSVHLEAKTAYLALLLRAAGAQVAVTGSNPLSTKDDVCAALCEMGMEVNAWFGATSEEYHEHIRKTLEFCPHIIIDDGGDFVSMLCSEHPEYAVNLIGGCEETTTGIQRLRGRAAAGKLPFPMMAVNDANCKHLFDNRHGTGQSVWDGIMRTTNLVVAGCTAVVSGYGWCGKGVAMRAKGLGAKVVVTEVDPVKAIEAVMDGFEVLPMAQAAPLGDIFVTVTGCDSVITPAHMLAMKDGAMLCNAGHFDVEVDVAGLKAMAVSHSQARRNIEGYVLPGGKTLYLLAEGRLVNLAAGDGHPVEIMDMSFALQALCARRVALDGGKLPCAVLPVPADIDGDVACRKLAALGVGIDTLTPQQARYLNG